MLPFRLPPMNGVPVAPGMPLTGPPHGMAPPGLMPGMMAMRGPPPRGPPPLVFPPGPGPPPGAMMARGPMSLPPGPPGTTNVAVVPVVSLAELGMVNVFVGKLPTDLNDAYVRNLLEKCGQVVSWKRTVDPVTMKSKGFGYCTFATATDALRALRLLNGFSVDSKQIVVKADNKMQPQLDAYTATLPDVIRRQEHERDAELRRELKALEDERSGLKGGTQNHPELWGDLLGPQVRKASADEGAEKNTQDTDHETAEDGGHAPVKVQQKMILSEIEKFRLAQDQREQELEQKRREAVRERLRQGQEEEQRRQGTQEANPTDFVPSINPPETKKDNAEGVAPKPTESAKNEQTAQAASEDVNPVELITPEKVDAKAKTPDDRDCKRDRSRPREKRDRERGHRDRDRDHRKRTRSYSRSRSRERSRRRRRRSKSYSRSRSRSHDRSRRDRKRDRESSRRRRRRRNSSAADEDMEEDRHSKRHRDSEADGTERKSSPSEDKTLATSKPTMRVVMDLKMSLGAPKKEKTMPGPAPSLFKVEEEVEVKPVREFVKIDFAAEERAAQAAAQRKAAETAAKINARAEDVKALIDSIPTDKAGLFAYPIDWTAVEKHDIIKDKMTPWVNKKVHEYLGEEDATLISFILKKLATRTKPDDIFTELQAILEDEAEVFVKLLWRKLAFEALRAAA